MPPHRSVLSLLQSGAAADAPTPIASAVGGGLVSRSLGQAFACGYQAALAALVPALGAAGPLSLAVTERGGGHPRAIETILRPEGDAFLLDGAKTFATLALEARGFLVLAKAGERDGRPSLKLVYVAASAPGLVITERPPLPFAPDISHGTLRLSAVAVPPSAVLPGDGYADYAKPFRTVEDTHVLAAVIAYVLGVALRQKLAVPASVERLVATLASLETVAAADPKAPTTHLALAGAFATAAGSFEAIEPAWQASDPASFEAFSRDRPLLSVATQARGRRTALAHEAWVSKALGTGDPA